MFGGQPSVCTACGYTGVPKRVTKGSIIIEIVLWLCFLFPGLIYSIWRLTTKHQACPKCGNPTMIPADSPVGQKMISQNQANVPDGGSGVKQNA